MKKSIGILLLAITAIACTQQTDYKAVRDEVMKFHDVVMTDHEMMVNNRMKLDTLLKDLSEVKAKLPDADTLKEKEVITTMITGLTRAEESMNNWMYQFEPDITGKSNATAVQYFKTEKAKIAAIDSLYKKEIRSSSAYLKKFRK